MANESSALNKPYLYNPCKYPIPSKAPGTLRKRETKKLRAKSRKKSRGMSSSGWDTIIAIMNSWHLGRPELNLHKNEPQIARHEKGESRRPYTSPLSYLLMVDSGSIIAFKCVPTDDSIRLQWIIPTQLSHSQPWKLNESPIKTKPKVSLRKGLIGVSES